MNNTAKKVSAACALILLAAAAWGLLYGYARHRIAAAVHRAAAAMPGVSAVEVGRIRDGIFGGAVEPGETLVCLDAGVDPIRIDSVLVGLRLADARRIRISVPPNPRVSVGWLLRVWDPARLIVLIDLRIEA